MLATGFRGLAGDEAVVADVDPGIPHRVNAGLVAAGAALIIEGDLHARGVGQGGSQGSAAGRSGRFKILNSKACRGWARRDGGLAGIQSQNPVVRATTEECAQKNEPRDCRDLNDADRFREHVTILVHGRALARYRRRWTPAMHPALAGAVADRDVCRLARTGRNTAGSRPRAKVKPNLWQQAGLRLLSE
jgi:hypothetical protein